MIQHAAPWHNGLRGQTASLPELHSRRLVLPKVLSRRLPTKGTEKGGSCRIYGDNQSRR